MNPDERRRPVFRDRQSMGSAYGAPPAQTARPVQPVRPMQSARPLAQQQMPPRPQSPGMPPQGMGPRSAGQSPRRRWPIARIIIILLILLVLLGVPAWFLTHHKKPVAVHDGSTTVTGGSSSPDTIRLLATGDFIAHDSVNAAAKQADGSYDYLPLMNDFPQLFSKADIRFCNDPILNGGSVSAITGYPKFNSPTEFVTSMGKLGCNLANTASNHSFDYTQANITASVQAWDKVRGMLAVAGENKDQAGHDAVHYFTMKGVKFAFLAYTTYINTDAPAQNNYGVNVFSKDFAGQQIADAKQNGAKFIIASMRWGTEYATSTDDTQKADAQWLADQGVNLVLGHGSHELQPVATLTGSGGNKTQVWYSLGNFLNTQEPAETLFNGLAVLDIDAKTLEIKNTSYLPIYQHYEWTAAQAKADDTNARTHVHLYLLEDATQDMLDAQQLKTSVAAQKQRLTSTLSQDGMSIPLITSKQYLAGQ